MSHKQSKALVRQDPADSSQVGFLQVIHDRAKTFINQSRAPNTIRAYESDWKDFEEWCRSGHFSFLPADSRIVALYLTQLSETHKVSTLERRMAAISQRHQVAGLESPTRATVVRELMKGIKRVKGSAQVGKEPLLLEDLIQLTERFPVGLLGVRDRAMLLIGFLGGFRRSEIAGLDVGDVKVSREGLTVTLRRSKTDQEGAGREIAIPYSSNPDACAVRAFQAWVEQAAITEGPLFRAVAYGQAKSKRICEQTVADRVKRWAKSLGKTPEEFGGHSLRSGFVTSATERGATQQEIMEQTGHKSPKVLQVYIKRGNRFKNNAAGRLGL